MYSLQSVILLGAVQPNRLAPIHPGEILGEDLQDAGISLNELARSLRSAHKSGQRDRERETLDHSGHRDAPGAVFRHIIGVLDEPSERL